MALALLWRSSSPRRCRNVPVAPASPAITVERQYGADQIDADRGPHDRHQVISEPSMCRRRPAHHIANSSCGSSKYAMGHGDDNRRRGGRGLQAMAGCVQRVSTITTAATNSQNAMSIMTAIASPAVLARTRRSGSVILSPSSASTKHLTAAEGSEPQRPMGVGTSTRPARSHGRSSFRSRCNEATVSAGERATRPAPATAR